LPLDLGLAVGTEFCLLVVDTEETAVVLDIVDIFAFLARGLLS
jgi:cytosine/adenosine deaminase-related metal-dependent hydrolase